MQIMKEPNYKLVFKERILVPKCENKTKDIIKGLLFFFVVASIILSLIVGENIFTEFSFIVWVCILSSVWYLYKNSGYEKVPSDCELWFYDDQIIQYRPKRYYSRRKIRKEYYIFLYKDIKKCCYRTQTGKINIYGVLEGIFYDYDKNGNLEQKPSYHKTVDAISNFYVTLEPDIDFVKIIETHSPIKVELHES